MEEEKKFTDDELIEDIDSDDDAPVEILYRCKKCGQILDKEAKDCWKCSSKEIEQVVEEETKEVKKVMLQARLDRVEHELKQVKNNNNFLYGMITIVVIVMIVFFLKNR